MNARLAEATSLISAERDRALLDTGRRFLRSGVSNALALGEYRTRFSRWLPNTSNAILTYHSVGDPGKYGNVSPERLRRDLRYLIEAFEVVDLPDVLRAPTSGSKRVAVTFDDGYENFYTHALPLCRELGVPVTVFVPPGFVDGRNSRYAYRFFRSPDGATDHNDPSGHESAGQPADVMSGARLAEVATDELVTIGNHTRLHPDLSAIENAEDLEAEILGARRDLEDRLGITVDRFSYPYGKYDERALEIVRRSHDLAVTTRSGLLNADPNRYRLPRISAHVPEPHLRWELTDVRWRLGARS